MQPISENRYIQDTLVMCGEYQLFIDEMRSRGKHHQPDHWGSNQFPGGKAKEPVLGMRHSDTTAYCAWLTERDNNSWAYRLPSQQEWLDFPMQFPVQKPLGYWVQESNGQSQFAWIYLVPGNVRGIDLFHSFARAFERSNTKPTDQERALNRFLDLMRIFDLEKTLKQPLDLEYDLKLARKRAREHADALQYDFDLELSMEVDRIQDREFERAIGLARALDRSSERGNAFEFALNQSLARTIDPNRGIDHTFALDLAILVDLLTLQERIAGRAPAFEGIRLIKERVS
jgi:Sulfatase-modifying factor enzyme 1